MKNFIFIIAVYSAIFLESNLARVLGFGNSIHTVAFTPLIAFLCVQFARHKMKLIRRENNIAIILLLLGGLIILFQIFVGQKELTNIIIFLVIPILFSIYLEEASINEILVLRKAIILLLIVEFLISFYERMTYSVVLTSEDAYGVMNGMGDQWSFRASALFGHPINNAMIISIINIFILSSNMKIHLKLFYFFIALISLFCFNERGSILVTVITSIPFMIEIYRRGNMKTRNIYLCIFIPVLVLFVFFIMNSDFGGRLFNHEISKDDSSTMARMAALTFADYLDSNELLYGGSGNYDRLLIRMNMVGIENGFVAIILLYGLIISIPLILFLFIFHIQKLLVYDKWKAILIIIVFYGTGMTNPSLVNPLQWFIFICSYYAFRPHFIKSSNAYNISK